MADLKAFKRIVSMLESSGGRNVDHKTAPDPLHEGDKAYGEYGLMPKSVQTQARRNIRDGVAQPIDYAIKDSDSNLVKEMLKNNKDAEDYYTDTMLGKSLSRSKGDPEEAYYRWVYGDNANIEKAKQENPSISKRFKKMLDVIAPMSSSTAPTYDIPALEAMVDKEEPKEIVAASKMRDTSPKIRDIASIKKLMKP